MLKDTILELFESRKAHLDERINRDYVKNGIATIPCYVSDYHDVISSYTVRGCESLSSEFCDYLRSTAEMMPPECPLVLNIIGDSLSQDEKKVMDTTIKDGLAYNLGMVEKEEKRHTKTFLLMLIGLIILFIILINTRTLEDEPRELIFILFYFIGDTLCDYIFLTGYDLRRDRRLAGRLASIKVIFTDSYEAPNYTESDVSQLYSEIEKDVNNTLHEEDEEQ